MKSKGKPSVIAHQSTSGPLRIGVDHPALPGHFPGQPVVPGVLILEAVLAELRRRSPHLKVVGARRIKFLRRLDPGVGFELECGPLQAGILPFKCFCGGELLAEGRLLAGDA